VRSPEETGAERLKSVENADVYKDERLAGTLRRDGSDVVFRYHQSYLADPSAPPLAWSIPKYESDVRAAGGSVPAFFAGCCRKASGYAVLLPQPRRPKMTT